MQQIDDVFEQSAAVGVMLLHPRGAPFERGHQVGIRQHLVYQAANRLGADRPEHTGQLTRQPLDVGGREHAEFSLIDRPRIDPADRRDDDLQGSRIKLHRTLDTDVIPFVEGFEIVVGGVPHAAGDGPAAIGQFHLQIELTVAIGPQLLPRRQKHLFNLGSAGEFRDPLAA